MKKKEPKIVDSPLTREEAEWMRGVEEKTARLQVEYLKASTDVRRPIDTLTKVHLSALSEIARSTYIGEVSERRAKIKLTPAETVQLDMWLI